MSDFKAKIHQVRFRLGGGYDPDPAGGDYRALPDPVAGLGGPTYNGRGRESGGKYGGGNASPLQG